MGTMGPVVNNYTVFEKSLMMNKIATKKDTKSKKIDTFVTFIEALKKVGFYRKRRHFCDSFKQCDRLELPFFVNTFFLLQSYENNLSFHLRSQTIKEILLFLRKKGSAVILTNWY